VKLAISSWRFTSQTMAVMSEAPVQAKRPSEVMASPRISPRRMGEPRHAAHSAALIYPHSWVELRIGSLIPAPAAALCDRGFHCFREPHRYDSTSHRRAPGTAGSCRCSAPPAHEHGSSFASVFWFPCPKAAMAKRNKPFRSEPYPPSPFSSVRFR
jgi:hypothetical protein